MYVFCTDKWDRNLWFCAMVKIHFPLVPNDPQDGGRAIAKMAAEHAAPVPLNTLQVAPGTIKVQKGSRKGTVGPKADACCRADTGTGEGLCGCRCRCKCKGRFKCRCKGKFRCRCRCKCASARVGSSAGARVSSGGGADASAIDGATEEAVPHADGNADAEAATGE
jgi:hypothetical protein